ncbi:MAG: ABC transporter ATP-binding protein [Albidovulum sp.]|nr:ABC transporter ATP-binding protein [Albidovulum sp.]
MRYADLIEPFEHASGSPPNTLAQFYIWCLKGSFPLIFIGAGISMIAGSIEVCTALLLGFVIDGALMTDRDSLFSENLLLIAGSIAFFLLLRPLVFGASSAVSSILVTPNVSAQVLSRLHRHTMSQAVEFFDDDFAGRIAQKQLQTSRAITDTVVEFINVVSFAVASLIGSVLLLTAINVWIALVLFIWLGSYVILIRWYLPLIRSRSRSRAGARSDLSGQIVDTVTNIKTVKLFAHSDHEDKAALDAMRRFRLKAQDFGVVASSFRFCLITLSGFLPVILVGGALFFWSRGAATAGDIAATGAVSLRIAQMSGWVSFVLMAIYSNIGEAEDGMRTLAKSRKIVDRPGAKSLSNVRGEIEFDSVSFRYGRPSGGLVDVNLKVNPGEHVGIVGASGAGKSTLAALLLRLYEPETGRITIDGCDLSEVTQESLRSHVAMVTQETAMFNRPALDNIQYGRPESTREEVVEAAKSAEAHEFIVGLQDHLGRKGYGAYLGERGIKLSGGQRQRIALARAVLKDAPILILDEATSALDSALEASIQDALGRVMETKTVIAIAHRLSTISRMDRIIVLEQGRVTEQGSHGELLAKGGLFSLFWNRQSNGFIGVDRAAE